MSDVLINFSDVRKSFGPKLIYLGLNLSIVRGEVLTICGGSGVGKSVMLKMLIGLLKPDKGSIVFDDQEVTRMNEVALSDVRRRIAMLFQGAALFDSLSVGENVGYGLEEHFRYTMNRDERRER
ncbi:MAG TPA: ATP-binding cassette domain-containing protein, partial [Polyangiaceae bacterium]|nr:ATP-binding cassette domain-containing protein [Polyangiaceae bacterium]